MITHHMAGAGTEVTTLGKCRPLVYAFSERLWHVRQRPSMSFWCLRMVANKTDGQRRRSEVTSAGTICRHTWSRGEADTSGQRCRSLRHLRMRLRSPGIRPPMSAVRHCGGGGTKWGATHHTSTQDWSCSRRR